MENFTLGLKKEQLFIYQFLGELMTFFEDISSAEFSQLYALLLKKSSM